MLVIGPVLSRNSGYAFDSWSPGCGLRRGYTYNRIEDAYYARKREIKEHDRGNGEPTVTCSTFDDFERSTRFGL